MNGKSMLSRQRFRKALFLPVSTLQKENGVLKKIHYDVCFFENVHFVDQKRRLRVDANPRGVKKMRFKMSWYLWTKLISDFEDLLLCFCVDVETPQHRKCFKGPAFMQMCRGMCNIAS